jgi:hypothetical protein
VSLAIDIHRVSSVLLADGWHPIVEGSFDLDSYEYVDSEIDFDHPLHCRHGGGRSGVCPTGFTFLEDVDENAGLAYQCKKVEVSGPLTAILAVIHSREGTA